MNNSNNQSFRKKSILLNGKHLSIRRMIEKELLNYLDGESRVKIHLRYHYFKYLYVIDRILRANKHWNRPLTSFHYINYNSLFELTNHKSIKLKDGSKITLAKMLTKVLINAKLIVRSKSYSRKKKLSYEYKALKISGVEFEYEDIENLFLTVHDLNFIKKLEARQEKKFYLDSKIAKKMVEWMERLDFRHVPMNKLPQKHQVSISLFHESKFQTISNTGRIYNSFTNLPKTIRKYLIVNGDRLGELDIANAQAVFLGRIIKERLENEGAFIDADTEEFIIWAELGKVFEFLNGKVEFSSPQARTSYKKTFWAMIMDKSSNSKTYKIIESVRVVIPQILNSVDLIKAKDHRTISQLLQREESRVVFACYESIMNEVSSSPLHDAWFFPVSEKDRAVPIIIDNLKDLGVNCTLEWKGIYPYGGWEREVKMTFDPEEKHWAIINEHQELFRKYPFWNGSDSQNDNPCGGIQIDENTWDITPRPTCEAQQL